MLPRSGLKIADCPDRTESGLDQTAQAVCSLQSMSHGPDRGLWLSHNSQNRVVHFFLSFIGYRYHVHRISISFLAPPPPCTSSPSHHHHHHHRHPPPCSYSSSWARVQCSQRTSPLLPCLAHLLAPPPPAHALSSSHLVPRRPRTTTTTSSTSRLPFSLSRVRAQTPRVHVVDALALFSPSSSRSSSPSHFVLHSCPVVVAPLP